MLWRFAPERISVLPDLPPVAKVQPLCLVAGAQLCLQRGAQILSVEKPMRLVASLRPYEHWLSQAVSVGCRRQRSGAR